MTNKIYCYESTIADVTTGEVYGRKTKSFHGQPHFKDVQDFMCRWMLSFLRGISNDDKELVLTFSCKRYEEPVELNVF